MRLNIKKTKKCHQVQVQVNVLITGTGTETNNLKQLALEMIENIDMVDTC